MESHLEQFQKPEEITNSQEISKKEQESAKKGRDTTKILV